MIEIILAICTVLGGLAAGWFILDKIHTVDWRQYRWLHGTDRHRVLQRANDQPGKRQSWPTGLEPDFPKDLRRAVLRQFPEYRLPQASDICGDWALFGDSTTLFPFMCRGRFISDMEHYACLLLPKDGPGFKVAVLSGDPEVEPIHLTHGSFPPHNLFLRTVEPGNYATVKGKGYGSFQDADIPRVLRLRRDGINFGQFESADSIFYWKPKRKQFVQVPMSD